MSFPPIGFTADIRSISPKSRLHDRESSYDFSHEWRSCCFPVKRAIGLIVVLMLVTAHRLPAPIQEIAESPTPTPEQAAKLQAEQLHTNTTVASLTFIESFVKALGSNDLGAQLGYYAEQVHYYELGHVPKDVVRKDLQHDITTWPNRTYSIEGRPEVAPTNNGLYAEFRMKYTLTNSKGTSSGTLQMAINYKLRDQMPEITAIQKKVIQAGRQK